jgi:signal transduction histidine kinase
MSPCDLLEIVRESVVEQHVTWPERRIVLDLPRRNTLLITGDADRIGQVVTNYLTNALKYAPEEQPVTVKVRARTGFARVEVCDQGPGIAPEEQQHLFERFYRVPGIKVQQRAEVGLGLGLFICRTIIERHGGRVGVISAPGEGTRFWFTVPLASGREAGT